MELTSSIQVSLPCGREIDLTNTLTYVGVSSITKLLARRTSSLEFTHLYLRYATVRIDADDASTNFNSQEDIKTVNVEDFKNELGSAGYAVFQLTSGVQILKTDDNYEANIIRFPVSFQAAQLGSKFKSTNLTNYSIIYYMGLAERPQPTTISNFVQADYDAGVYDEILSVIKIGDKDLFGLPDTGTVDVKYDLNLTI